jgi:hypothetical protein
MPAIPMTLDRHTIMKIALEARLDPRTVKRAADRGVDSMQSEYDRARLRDALKKLKCEGLFK